MQYVYGSKCIYDTSHPPPVVSARWQQKASRAGTCASVSENMYIACHFVCFLRERVCCRLCIFQALVWQRDGVTARWMRYAWGRAERLKESSLRGRRRRLCESPSPAVLLVDAHVHFPGSVFRDPPVRHQQTDTCGEKRHARADQQAAGRAHTCSAVRPLYRGWQLAGWRSQNGVTEESLRGLVKPNAAKTAFVASRHTYTLHLS